MKPSRQWTEKPRSLRHQRVPKHEQIKEFGGLVLAMLLIFAAFALWELAEEPVGMVESRAAVESRGL